MSAVVVALPTAAARKVRQRFSRVRAADLKALAYLPVSTPTAREADKIAATISEIEPSAAMVIASAVFQVLEPRQRTMVQMYCALASNTAEGRQAAAWLRLIGGEQAAKEAVSRLDNGGGE